MKTTVTRNDFHNAFKNIRPDKFSYDGLNALFDYMEQLEENLDTEIGLDVIDICCNFTEYENLTELQENYNDIETMMNIEDNTTVIYIDDPPWQYGTEYDNRFIIQNY